MPAPIVSQTRRSTTAPRRRRIAPTRPRPTARPPVATNPTVTTPSGLTFIITRRGAGRQLKAGDSITVNYTGLLTNGAKFDSSLDRGTPFTFVLGAGRVIKGWDEGFARLRIGDHATLIIPSQLGYGSRGAGADIPPNATLVFIVEVIGVEGEAIVTPSSNE